MTPSDQIPEGGESLGDKLALFVFGTFIAVARTMADGWAIWVFWGWFIVPLGLPQIGFWHACGLDLMIGMVLAMAATQPPSNQRTIERLAYSAAKIIIAPAAVGMGYLIQLGVA